MKTWDVVRTSTRDGGMTTTWTRAQSAQLSSALALSWWWQHAARMPRTSSTRRAMPIARIRVKRIRLPGMQGIQTNLAPPLVPRTQGGELGGGRSRRCSAQATAGYARGGARLRRALPCSKSHAGDSGRSSGTPEKTGAESQITVVVTAAGVWAIVHTAQS
jgi:hypothetical protein